jgi:hypothetical protein
MREEIKLKTTKSGTTINFFDTLLVPNGIDIYSAYVLLNEINQPIYIGTFENIPMWRAEDNNYVTVESLGLPFLTGGTRYEELPYSLTQEQKQRLSNKWATNMALFSSGPSISHTFFKDITLDDMFIDIGLHRTYGTLDTLSLYNNTVNSFPVQESKTGTVFGKLTAIQKLIDNDGNNISIPLKNVPVCIFNQTEEFPTPASTDANGNRITLNLRESSPASSYFNIQSYTADTTSYLRSGSEFTAVPAYYKYVTTTNEEGEFVLHNVPIGTQTLFFEVDLFKQGLTQDEIALNFFPFPADDTPNLSRLPNLFFRQIPIDVVPTWGTVQTGYTEVNVSIDLDLRKWATYFVEQVSFNGLDFDELQRRGFISPLTIEIRNMAKEGYPNSKLQIVEIPNMVARDPDHALLWENEFPQLKNKATFYTQGYHAFKLPANMYDPVGRKTDQNGFATGSKGVWLAGYQMSLYFNDKRTIFRNTGLSKFKPDPSSVVTRDHYNLNKNNVDLAVPNTSAAPLIGDFPYERKWDHKYPEPYSIPHVPNERNPEYDTLNTLGKRWLERPRFLDGDMAGSPFGQFQTSSNPYGGTGGYGVAKDNTNGEWFKTDFSKYVTCNYVYNYENTENPNSLYTNGYKPNDSGFPVQPLASNVFNGEKYQRLECGYGYWLKPEGWPRIVRYYGFNGMDLIYPFDTERSNQHVNPASINLPSDESHSIATYDTSFEFLSTTSGKKLFIHMGTEANIKEGALDIFRLVDPSPQNLNPTAPTIVETFTDYRLGLMFFQRGRDWTSRLFMGVDNSGGGNGNEFWGNGGTGWEISISEMRLNIRNSGSITVDFLGRRLAPGASADFFGAELGTSGTFEGAIIRLPGNYDFDYNTFKYRKTRYDFSFKNVKLYNGEGGLFAGNAVQEGPTHERALMQMTMNAGPADAVPQAYLRSYLTNVNTFCTGRSTVIVPGMAFPNPDQGGGRGDPFWGARFWPWYPDLNCYIGVPYRDDANGE